jgi:serine phosphatase RsbU (regulator of sigma subunit)/tetratricopeptide (TPR) repeat protein
LSDNEVLYDDFLSLPGTEAQNTDPVQPKDVPGDEPEYCPSDFSVLVDRDTELATLLKLGDAVRAGLGRVALLIGDPGIGKTRLIDEWESAEQGKTAAAPLRWARAGCPSDSRMLAYCMLENLVLAILGVTATADEPETAGALDSLVEELFSSDRSGELDAGQDRGAAVYASLAHLLSLQLEGPAAGAIHTLDPQALQTQYLIALRQLLQALAARSPLVLVLENLHWADPSSIELLGRLLPLASVAPVLFCLVTRPDANAPGWKLVVAARELMGQSLTELLLPALSDPDSEQLISDLLCPQAVPDEIVDLILAKAEGNPLFVKEVTRVLLDRGAIARRGERWVLRSELADIEIPDTLQGALIARIDRLPDEARETLFVASVIGRQFAVSLLGQVLGRSRMWLVGRLNALESAGLVVVHQVAPELAYRFRSVLTQEVAYALIPASERQALHLDIGETIERLYPKDHLPAGVAPVLAHHLALALEGRTGDSMLARRTVAYLTLSGDTALAAYANREAEGYYRRGLELTSSAANRIDLLYGLGEALSRQSRLQEAIEVWREGIALCQSIGDGDRMARLYALISRAAWYSGDRAQGLQWCEEGLEQVERVPESVGVAVLLHEVARSLRPNRQDQERARSLCMRALEIARRLDAVEVQADALTTLGILPDQPAEAAVRALTAAVELSESAGLTVQAWRAHNNLGAILHEKLSDLRGAQEHLQRAAELSHRIGDIEREIVTVSNLCDLLLLTGDITSAIAAIRSVHTLLDESANPGPGRMGARINEALSQRYQGELFAAIRHLEACWDDARQQGMVDVLFLAGNTMAEAWLESWALPGLDGPGAGSTARAAQLETILAETIQIGDQRLTMGSAWPRSLLGMARAYQGRFEEAHSLVEDARQRAGDQLAPLDQARLLWAEANVAVLEKRWTEAASAFDAVAGLYDRMGMRWWQARALYARAEVCASRRESTDLERGRTLLREALVLFEALHVPRYSARIRERSQALLAELYVRAMAHGQVAQELVVAGQIQTGFLPSPPSLPGWQLLATLKPARATSGDFYDFIALPNGRWGIVIADVADKGMGAALYMALSRTLIRTFAAQYHASPEVALRVTNSRILADVQATTFVTVFYGVLDPRTGTLHYCNAGHNPPYLVRPGGAADRGIVARPLNRTGMALGVTRDAKWEQAAVQIEPGDLLVLYTDGITEAPGAGGSQYGEERLLQVLEATAAPAPGAALAAQGVHDGLLAAVHAFTGDVPQFDDISLIVVARDRAS